MEKILRHVVAKLECGTLSLGESENYPPRIHFDDGSNHVEIVITDVPHLHVIRGHIAEWQRQQIQEFAFSAWNCLKELWVKYSGTADFPTVKYAKKLHEPCAVVSDKATILTITNLDIPSVSIVSCIYGPVLCRFDIQKRPCRREDIEVLEGTLTPQYAKDILAWSADESAWQEALRQWHEEQKADEESIYELAFRMTELSQDMTGLPMVVWVDCDEFLHDEPILQFQDSHSSRWDLDSLVSVSLCEKPKLLGVKHIVTDEELQALFDWIALNLNLLTRHRNQEIDSVEVWESVQRIDRRIPIARVGDMEIVMHSAESDPPHVHLEGLGGDPFAILTEEDPTEENLTIIRPLDDNRRKEFLAVAQHEWPRFKEIWRTYHYGAVFPPVEYARKLRDPYAILGSREGYMIAIMDVHVPSLSLVETAFGPEIAKVALTGKRPVTGKDIQVLRGSMTLEQLDDFIAWANENFYRGELNNWTFAKDQWRAEHDSWTYDQRFNQERKYKGIRKRTNRLRIPRQAGT